MNWIAPSFYLSFRNNLHIGRKIILIVICKQRLLVATGNSKRVGHPLDMIESDEVEAWAHTRYSKDLMLSLILMLDSSEDSFALMYSSTFSTTTTLDLRSDEEFLGTATTDGSFSSFQTFHSFTNVKTLNLLEQSPLYLSHPTVIMLDRYTHGRRTGCIMQCLCCIPPMASWNTSTSPRK